MFFRAITSAEIRLHPANYRRFFDVEDERMFPDYICQAQVESCGVYAGARVAMMWNTLLYLTLLPDHPQILALASALRLRIQIAEATLDTNQSIKFINMPTGKDDENWDSGITDLVLLRRCVDPGLAIHKLTIKLVSQRQFDILEPATSKPVSSKPADSKPPPPEKLKKSRMCRFNFFPL